MALIHAQTEDSREHLCLTEYLLICFFWWRLFLAVQSVTLFWILINHEVLDLLEIPFLSLWFCFFLPDLHPTRAGCVPVTLQSSQSEIPQLPPAPAVIKLVESLLMMPANTNSGLSSPFPNSPPHLKYNLHSPLVLSLNSWIYWSIACINVYQDKLISDIIKISE